MARFCSLFSSSSGNCTYVGSSQGGILIDCGVSAKKTTLALASIGVSPSDIRAIFVTHEHTDHINGVRVFASKNNIKVYASEGTLDGMEQAGALNKVEYEPLSYSGIETAGMNIRPFRTPHDANESTGFCIVTPDGKRISVATDIGYFSDTVLNAVHGSDIILLESNHDIGMLQNGPYPFYLKQRILSKHGHLSNESCAEAAVRLLESGTTRFVLGHLSKENNLPMLAYQTTNSALKLAGATENSDYILKVAGQSPEMLTL